MVHLSNGTQDVTGHRIWPGALLFVSALPSLAGRLLQNRRVLELGTGTGLAGIAIDRSCRVQCLVLTDASDSALDLCRRNCATNRVSDRVAVEKLVWGELDGPSGERSARGEGAGGPVEPPPPAFDTVVATDVVYDLDSWKPLLDTVSRRLREGGTMILSHVPRAALPSYSPREKRKTIEEIIVEQARCYDLHLGETMYPAELLSVATKDGSGANKMDLCLRELQETGASILLFQKQTGCSSPCPFDRVSDR
jgi:cyclopropane fatty-acyl-phospholipid synthase-like methyltransferase